MPKNLFKVTALGSLALLSIRCGDELPANFGRNPAEDAPPGGEGGALSSSGDSGCAAVCGGNSGNDGEDPSGGSENPGEDFEGPGGGSGGGNAEPLGGASSGQPGEEEAGSSSGGTPSASPPEPSLLFEAVRAVMEEHCVDCHRSASHVNLENDDTLHARLTEPLTTNVCRGRVLVVPSSPESSLLLESVQGATDCVRRMPFGCELGVGISCLSDGEVAVIREWIEAGAPE